MPQIIFYEGRHSWLYLRYFRERFFVAATVCIRQENRPKITYNKITQVNLVSFKVSDRQIVQPLTIQTAITKSGIYGCFLMSSSIMYIRTNSIFFFFFFFQLQPLDLALYCRPCLKSKCSLFFFPTKIVWWHP